MKSAMVTLGLEELTQEEARSVAGGRDVGMIYHIRDFIAKEVSIIAEGKDNRIIGVGLLCLLCTFSARLCFMPARSFMDGGGEGSLFTRLTAVFRETPREECKRLLSKNNKLFHEAMHKGVDPQTCWETKKAVEEDIIKAYSYPSKDPNAKGKFAFPNIFETLSHKPPERLLKQKTATSIHQHKKEPGTYRFVYTGEYVNGEPLKGSFLGIRLVKDKEINEPNFIDEAGDFVTFLNDNSHRAFGKASAPLASHRAESTKLEYSINSISKESTGASSTHKNTGPRLLKPITINLPVAKNKDNFTKARSAGRLHTNG